jgi:hypothetical protein
LVIDPALVTVRVELALTVSAAAASADRSARLIGDGQVEVMAAPVPVLLIVPLLVIVPE